MKIIGVTTEEFIEGEAHTIATLLKLGVDAIHLRKPSAPSCAVAELLGKIPAELHPQLVLHDHFTLVQHFPLLGGIHLNARHPHPPLDYTGAISRSCHTIDELRSLSPAVSYAFLSPIYNSISKQGYTAAFTHDTLAHAHAEGVINHRVVALGGICPNNIAEVKRYGFGGMALLGYLWQDLSENILREKIDLIKQATL